MAFFALLKRELVDESLTGILTPDARADCASPLFGPPRGTNLKILEDSGPPSDTGRDVVTDS